MIVDFEVTRTVGTVGVGRIVDQDESELTTRSRMRKDFDRCSTNGKRNRWGGWGGSWSRSLLHCAFIVPSSETFLYLALFFSREKKKEKKKYFLRRSSLRVVRTKRYTSNSIVCEDSPREGHRASSRGSISRT